MDRDTDDSIVAVTDPDEIALIIWQLEHLTESEDE